MTENTQLLPTEQNNPRTKDLDKHSPLQIARTINAEDFNAARAVKKAGKDISSAIIVAAKTHQNGGKIIFIGAGTSGRLGILEAAECVPTFGTRPSQIIGLIAGGKKAVFHSQEGAEDDKEQGKKDICKKASGKDFVIGIAASGRTPYVMGALQEATRQGAATALISCNPKADIRFANIHICLETGAEVLSGSTRMKAGTATKMALNAITTGAMVLCGKTYGNLMIDVRPTNEKLLSRAAGLLCQITGITDKKARALLQKADYNVKTAVLMQQKNISKNEALKTIKKHRGFLAEALHEK